jgi:hypothetical protein
VRALPTKQQIVVLPSSTLNSAFGAHRVTFAGQRTRTWQVLVVYDAALLVVIDRALHPTLCYFGGRVSKIHEADVDPVK